MATNVSQGEASTCGHVYQTIHARKVHALVNACQYLSVHASEEKCTRLSMFLNLIASVPEMNAKASILHGVDADFGTILIILTTRSWKRGARRHHKCVR